MNYLALKHVETNQRLLSLLPADVALQCHAVPVAWDGNRVTVAMAHPEDDAARQAVIAALGLSTCIVQADPMMLEQLLQQFRVAQLQHKKDLHALFWNTPGTESESAREYARTLAGLLNAELTSIDIDASQAAALTLISQAAAQQSCDLLCYAAHPARNSSQQWIPHLQTNLLVIRAPHLPLRSILLVLHQATLDSNALEWCLLLARASGASITLLPILLPVPGMLTPELQHALPALLSSNCPLGDQLRDFSRRMVQAGVNGSIRLRQETPEQQVRQELHDADYDLVAIALDPEQRQITASLQTALQFTNQPLLMVQNAPGQA